MKYFTANPVGLYDDENNVIPDDAINISEEQYQRLLEGQRIGKFIQANSAGIPVLVDELPQTHAQRVAAAKGLRAELLATANMEIAWRQDALDTGIATKEESSMLAEWKKYRVLLMRVDISKAPDIAWPVQP
ncbi:MULTISPECIES: tail fiber assembly protein [Klebsiella]|uniref:tail fiber assembly protein n=1 Tax=Klebsiella TaxID=570 RepID=UPI00131F89E0|nr:MULTISPECIES: tail fiber assembly protein [Klebsiella]EIQ4510694.1 tail fiber assembly protein [Salmonella enterica]EJB5048237.1 tail fiber assembly protein [Salmonella enterica]MWV33560.1 tail fiber assembly protein [Klebsiella pneumoniae]QHD73350.1 tail fiber assembly protein [Klebsiella pneumoniae]QUY27544.1 tail fiber assembly protein [Klebsiella pneumoniae]